MKKRQIALLLSAVTCLIPAKANEDSKSSYEKLLGENHRRENGLVDLHLIKGKVYMELPLNLIGREFLMGSTIRSISDNHNGIIGAKPSELKHICFSINDSTVFMREVDASSMSKDENIEAALSKSNAGGIIKAMEAKAWRADSSAVVIDVTDIFLSHDKQMSPFNEYGAYASYKRSEDFKKDLSYIVDIRSFEDNFSVTSSLSYTYSLSRGEVTLLKDEPLTAELTRSVILLPEKTYHPRTADPRIGVFHTERTEYGVFGKGSSTRYLANRWRLEPSDTAAYRAGQAVEPVKPIVFYIDSNFPQWWKPYIKEGVQQWQELFEEIGFKNAILAKDFPSAEEDPQFDPENLKYNCIRYAPIGIQNAMGPSWTDPRSGEIINAAVYVYHDIVKLITKWMFVQTAQADEAVRSRTLPREVLGDAIRYVISHEIGHTLGFMHNMSASYTVPVEMLRDPEFTNTHGTTASIMDYARFNYVAQPGDKERGVRLTPPRFGEYDRWLIKWTYTPVFDAADFKEETAITTKWITDAIASNPVFRYGKQQLSSALFDPRCQNEDLGDDAIAATVYGVKNLKYITANFIDWLSEEDNDFEFRTEIYNALLNQYLAYAQHVLLNVGGLYKNEVYDGDPLPVFENIPRRKQVEALNYVFELADDLDWVNNPSVTRKLPIVGDPAKVVRQAIYEMIMSAPYLCSLSDGLVTNEFDAVECMDIIWDKVWKTSSKLSAAQRQAQKIYLAQMLQTGSFKTPQSASSSIAASVGVDAEELNFGSISYNPVSGFEWVPRTTALLGKLTRGDIYAQLDKTLRHARKMLKKASGVDKGHYQEIIYELEYALR